MRLASFHDFEADEQELRPLCRDGFVFDVSNHGSLGTDHRRFLA
jgi:hypothetical protein